MYFLEVRNGLGKLSHRNPLLGFRVNVLNVILQAHVEEDQTTREEVVLLLLCEGLIVAEVLVDSGGVEGGLLFRNSLNGVSVGFIEDGNELGSTALWLSIHDIRGTYVCEGNLV